MKKKQPIHPLLSVATLCLLPAALNAQQGGAPAPADTAGSTTSRPSTSTRPSEVSVPTSPSQPAGFPQPGGAPLPGGTSQPAGTQASAFAPTEDPTLQLRALAGVEHESNALRQPGSSSDEAAILGVGAKVNKRFGLQRLRADVEANTYRYRRQSGLNFSTINYALAWDWSFTPALHGIVSADRKQYREVTTDPTSFANRVGRRTERAEVAEGIYNLGAAWRVLAGASHTRSESTVPATWDASPSVRSARVGVGYERADDASLYGRFRRGDGEYHDPTVSASASDFRENEAELALKWPITGKTSVDARLGHIEREHSGAPRRDFSGVIGAATVNWEATGKTRVGAGVSRDLSASGLTAGGHVENQRFFVGPVWRATAQIAVNARLEHTKRDWKDVPAGALEAGRSEKIRALSAGVDWEPRRWLTATAYVRGERLKSTLASAGYRSTTVGVAVKAYF